MALYLPNQDPDSATRNAQLVQTRQAWQVAPHQALASTPFLAKVPNGETPSTAWFVMVASLQPALFLNKVSLGWQGALSPLASEGLVPVLPPSPMQIASSDEAESTASKVLHHVLGGTESLDVGPVSALAAAPKRNLPSYQKLFTHLPTPPIVAQWPSDEDGDSRFANFRVEGPNPEVLHHVVQLPEPFQATEARLAEWVNDSEDVLADVIHRGDLFMADYRSLSTLDARGPENLGGVPRERRLVAPIALFYQHRDKTLRSLAIAVEGAPATVYLPSDNAWRLARQAVQVADMNHHELSSHLARTHLVAELIAIATCQNLAPRHPLHALLAPHWTGTAFINDRARKDLVADGGAVDRTFGATIDSLRAYAAKQLASFDFDEEKLSHRFHKRGTASLARYPFRDAALGIAQVLRKWLTTYVNRWYPDEASLSNDGEAQAWFKALAQPLSKGGVPGFRRPEGLGDLVETLTLMVFLPSVQHAAVNFPQWTDMSWVAAFSGGLWGPLPAPSTATTNEDWLELLPPLPVALAQVELLYTLGTVRYAILGQRDAFGDAASDAALAVLRADLAALERAMLDKAKDDARPYLTLLPSLIPRSINI